MRNERLYAIKTFEMKTAFDGWKNCPKTMKARAKNDNIKKHKYLITKFPFIYNNKNKKINYF